MKYVIYRYIDTYHQHKEICFSKKEYFRFMSTSVIKKYLLAFTMVSEEIRIDPIGNRMTFSSVFKAINLKHYFGKLTSSVKNNLNKPS